MQISIEKAANDIRSAIRAATKGLIERESMAELIILGAVASEHLLAIGPPGTGKSAAVRHVAKALGGNYFEYLLGRYTEPSELFGTINLSKLKTGTVETETKGMLPEAEVVFLDEVFLGSTAVLNTLLGVLNERIFRRGHTDIRCPLRICVGASNALPDDLALAAFADRFLLHVFLESVPDSLLEDLLTEGWQLKEEMPVIQNGLEYLDFLAKTASNADMSLCRSALAHCIRLLRQAGIHLSDRRIVKSQKLISAAAVLAGRENPTTADIWPLIYAIPTQEGQQLARNVLHEQLEQSENKTLAITAEDAAASPAAREARLIEQLNSAFEKEADKLQLEALAREIDASFTDETMSETLREKRMLLVTKIEGIASETSI